MPLFQNGYAFTNLQIAQWTRQGRIYKLNGINGLQYIPRNLHGIIILQECSSLDTEEFFSRILHKVSSEVEPI